MGREGENLPLARASGLSAVDASKASGAALGGLHGRQDCRSGTKGQRPWCSLSASGLGRLGGTREALARWRASALTSSTPFPYKLQSL